VSISEVITLTGEGTHWIAGDVRVSLGQGTTTQAFSVTSPTSMTLTATVSVAAAPGPRTVTVTSGSETVSLPNALTILARERPVITQISPNSAPAGAQNIAVTFTGRGTRWAQGKTSVMLGSSSGLVPGVPVVSSPTSMTLTLDVLPAAAPGPREITVFNTGAGVASDTLTVEDGFTVTPPTTTGGNGLPRFELLPATSVEQGGMSNMLALVGEGTHWRYGETTVDFGPGTVITHFEVLSPAEIGVKVAPDADAEPGPRDVIVKTGSEVVTLRNGLTVIARDRPEIVSFSPNTSAAGKKVTVKITGRGTRWVQGTTSISLRFAPGITQVGEVRVDSPTSLSVTLSIDATAEPGVRQISALNVDPTTQLSSDVIIVPQAFTVTPAQTNPGVPGGPGRRIERPPGGGLTPATPGAAAPPRDPTNFTARQIGDRQVALAWDPVPGVSQYVVLGPGATDGLKVTGTTTTLSAVPYGSQEWLLSSWYDPEGSRTTADRWPRANVTVAAHPDGFGKDWRHATLVFTGTLENGWPPGSSTRRTGVLHTSSTEDFFYLNVNERPRVGMKVTLTLETQAPAEYDLNLFNKAVGPEESFPVRVTSTTAGARKILVLERHFIAADQPEAYPWSVLRTVDAAPVRIPPAYSGYSFVVSVKARKWQADKPGYTLTVDCE
jgi:hypothetical protein